MSKKNNLKQVSMESIDEGRFLQEMNLALVNLQEQIIAYSDRYGEKAQKAKAKLTVEVMIGCISPTDGAFGFATQIKQILPSPPPKVTMAMAGVTDDDKPALFARKSGSGKDYPTQNILCTEDGSKVDLSTGEVLDSMAGKV